jgi:hypothetical protein
MCGVPRSPVAAPEPIRSVFVDAFDGPPPAEVFEVGKRFLDGQTLLFSSWVMAPRRRS